MHFVSGTATRRNPQILLRLLHNQVNVRKRYASVHTRINNYYISFLKVYACDRDKSLDYKISKMLVNDAQAIKMCIGRRKKKTQAMLEHASSHTKKCLSNNIALKQFLSETLWKLLKDCLMHSYGNCYSNA